MGLFPRMTKTYVVERNGIVAKPCPSATELFPDLASQEAQTPPDTTCIFAPVHEPERIARIG